MLAGHADGLKVFSLHGMRTRQEELRQVIYTTQDVPGLLCSYETAIHYIHEAGIEKETKPASKNLISPLRQ